MTRQDGGTHDYRGAGRSSHRGRPRAAVARSLALVGVLFFMTACTGPFGTAMSGLFGAGAMYGGQAFLERGQEDVEAKREWRAKKRDYVRDFAAGMLFEANTQKKAGKFEDWRRIMGQLLTFWDSQHPETLVVELRRRVKDVVPEAKLVVAPD